MKFSINKAKLFNGVSAPVGLGFAVSTPFNRTRGSRLHLSEHSASQVSATTVQRWHSNALRRASIEDLLAVGGER
jgi:hypothetical protein